MRRLWNLHTAPVLFRLRLSPGSAHWVVSGESIVSIERAKSQLGWSPRFSTAEAARMLVDDIRVLCGMVGEILELEVDMPRKWNRRGHANLELRVPRGMNAESRVFCLPSASKLAGSSQAW